MANTEHPTSFTTRLLLIVYCLTNFEPRAIPLDTSRLSGHSFPDHLKAIIVGVIIYPKVYYVHVTFFKYTKSVSYHFIMFSLYMFLSRACTLNTVLYMFHHVLAHGTLCCFSLSSMSSFATKYPRWILDRGQLFALHNKYQVHIEVVCFVIEVVHCSLYHRWSGCMSRQKGMQLWFMILVHVHTSPPFSEHGDFFFCFRTDGIRVGAKQR